MSSSKSYQVPLTSSSSASQKKQTRQQDKSDKSPFIPTSLELSLLTLYPITLALGSLFATFSSATNNSAATYNAYTQAYDPPHLAPSYFAQKKNLFNVYFVKIGWFWVTAALGAFVLTNPFYGITGNRVDAKGNAGVKRRVGALLRWSIATVAWVFVTQWFFGPGLVDRSFILTGGACDVLEAKVEQKDMSTSVKALTHAACRKLGGQWRGGHDISGHVFILILGSALLWMEVLPVVLHARGLRHDRIVKRADGRVTDAGSLVLLPDDLKKGESVSTAVKEKLQEQKELATVFGVKFAVGVVALSWWMLLMTAAFFHTWIEKSTGLLVAFTALWTIYFAPRGVPALRKVIGMPGL